VRSGDFLDLRRRAAMICPKQACKESGLGWDTEISRCSARFFELLNQEETDSGSPIGRLGFRMIYKSV